MTGIGTSVCMVVLMFWLVFSEPDDITGRDWENTVLLANLPYAWFLTAIVPWLAFSAWLWVAKDEDIEEWQDIDRPYLGTLLGTWLLRSALLAAPPGLFLVVSGLLGLTYSVWGWSLLVAPVAILVVRYFRRGNDLLK